MRRKKRNSGKTFFRILFVVALIVVAFCAYEYWLKDDSDKQTTSPESQQNTTVDDGGNKGSNEDKDETYHSKDPIINYEGNDPNTAADLTGIITYNNVANNKLTLRVNIDQYLTTGTCKLSLVRDGSAVYSATAEIFANAATSSCKGFDIPLSNLSGQYEIVINLASDDRTGTISGVANL